MSSTFDVIVVGGGLAGLAAGATAAPGGATVAVLDAHRPGGRAQSTEADGFVFNRGVHALFLGGPGGGVLTRLGVTPTGAAPPLDRYRLLAGGEQHVLPLSADGLDATAYLDAVDKRQFGDLLGRLATTEPGRLPPRQPRRAAWQAGPRSRRPGLSRVFLAGDWVGPHGLLTDAVLASGHAAGRAALDVTTRSSRVA